MRQLFATGIAIAAVAGPLQLNEALAQSTTPSNDRTSTSTSSNSDIQEIVVTAQRREQRLIDVPISVQAISQDELTVAGVTDAPSLTQIAPALSFDQSFSSVSSSFSMRGALSLVDDASVQPSVGVVIDNVPVARQGEVVLDLVDL